MIVLKNILVATDFGDAAEVALTYGRELARNFGATLHVVHVVDDLASRMVGYPDYGPNLVRLQSEVVASAREPSGPTTGNSRRLSGAGSGTSATARCPTWRRTISIPRSMHSASTRRSP